MNSPPTVEAPASGLINIEQAAAMIGMSVPTLRFWRLNRVEGMPHGIKIGGRVRYDPDRLRQWIADRAAESGSEV